LYAVRDVTATVESIPLITASILSKKLAAGLDALAMDVKVGRGAFMERDQAATDLAHSITSVANGAGTPTVALLTDMDQPLGSVAGNALEVVYAIDYLTGKAREPRMHEVVMALGAEMLVLGKLARTVKRARGLLEACLANGAAAERFAEMVRALGGPPNLVAAPWKHLERAPIVRDVPSERSGVVRAIDTRGIGLTVVTLGGGRTRPQDSVDHAVGISSLAAVGDTIDASRPIAIVHARTAEMADRATEMIRAAYSIGRTAKPPRATVRGRVTD
jgi:thymidine phosphorylase